MLLNRQRLNNDTSPLCRFSILTYLRATHGHPHTSTLAPPTYSKLANNLITLTNPHTPTQDEEAGLGSQHLDDDEEGAEDCCWGFADGFALATYVGMIVIMVLNFDLFLSRWGVGTGIFTLGTASQQASEMVFCRTYQGNGQSSYRLLPSESTVCTHESITLFTSMEDTGFNISDGVLFTDIMTTGEVEKKNDTKFLKDEKAIDMEVNELGDDLAQEGKLSQPLPSPPTVPIQGGSMHAGFGGPWRARV